MEAAKKPTQKFVIDNHLEGKRIYLKKGMVSQRKLEGLNKTNILPIAIARKNLCIVFALSTTLAYFNLSDK